MFIKVTSSGGRRYAQLVESYRNENGVPRQRTICTFGRVEPGGDVDKLIAALRRAQGVLRTRVWPTAIPWRACSFSMPVPLATCGR